METFLRNIIKIFIFIVALVFAVRYAQKHHVRKDVAVIVVLILLWQIIHAAGWVLICCTKYSEILFFDVHNIISILSFIEKAETLPFDFLVIVALITISKESKAVQM